MKTKIEWCALGAVDETIISASPMVQGGGELPHRFVIRDLGDQYVVHTQVFDGVQKPYFHQGEYFPKTNDSAPVAHPPAEALCKAWARFEERARRTLQMPSLVNRLGASQSSPRECAAPSSIRSFMLVRRSHCYRPRTALAEGLRIRRNGRTAGASHLRPTLGKIPEDMTYQSRKDVSTALNSSDGGRRHGRCRPRCLSAMRCRTLGRRPGRASARAASGLTPRVTRREIPPVSPSSPRRAGRKLTLTLASAVAAIGAILLGGLWFGNRTGEQPADADAHDNRGDHPARPGEARGGDRRIPHGDPAQARLRRPPLQPRHRPASPGEAGGGDRRIPHGDPAQARRRRGPRQPRHRPAQTRGSWRRRSPNTARRSGSSPTSPRPTVNLGIALADQGKLEEAIAEYRTAIRLKPDLRRGPLQPRQRPSRPGEARGGDRRIPHGDPAQARLRRRPQQPRQRPETSRGSRRRRSPNSARRSGSSPTTPWPTSTSASPWTSKGSRRRRSPNSARRSGSSPTTPWPTSTSAPPWQPRGSWSEAVAEYRTAIRLKPDDAVVHYNLGIALRDQGKLDGGDRRIPQGSRQRPTRLQARPVYRAGTDRDRTLG